MDRLLSGVDLELQQYAGLRVRSAGSGDLA